MGYTKCHIIFPIFISLLNFNNTYFNFFLLFLLSNSGFEIQSIYWDHSGISGNETADHLAKTTSSFSVVHLFTLLLGLIFVLSK